MYSPQVLPTSVLQIYIRGDLRSLVNSVPIKNEATLPQRIFHARQTIHKLSGIFEIVRRFMLTLMDASID
jgi:hypothetical protein